MWAQDEVIQHNHGISELACNETSTAVVFACFDPADKDLVRDVQR